MASPNHQNKGRFRLTPEMKTFLSYCLNPRPTVTKLVTGMHGHVVGGLRRKFGSWGCSKVSTKAHRDRDAFAVSVKHLSREVPAVKAAESAVIEAHSHAAIFKSSENAKPPHCLARLDSVG
jgi:hypothetical protein